MIFKGGVRLAHGAGSRREFLARLGGMAAVALCRAIGTATLSGPR